MTRVGIVGAGQLGQMLGLAGRSLDLEFLFLDPSDEPPAAIAGPVLKAAYDDDQTLRELAARCDVVTYEFENVPVAAIERICDDVAVYPPPDALRYAQDRLAEKRLFESLDIEVPPYRAIDSLADLEHAAAEIGLPLVLKTRRLGYDGKGQAVVRETAALEAALTSLGGRDLIAEALVPFDCEVSAIGARNPGGSVVVYPLNENRHRDGILDSSRAPADLDALQAAAAGYLQRMLDRLDYVGILTIEFFVRDGRLLANEFAPRVHNSGHWTIEGAVTSQFENHLRAVLDMPLGDPAAVGHAGMLNLIGTIPAAARDLASDSAWLHDYGKAPRPGRKLGHITVVADSREHREAEMARILRTLVS